MSEPTKPEPLDPQLVAALARYQYPGIEPKPESGEDPVGWTRARLESGGDPLRGIYDLLAEVKREALSAPCGREQREPAPLNPEWVWVRDVGGLRAVERRVLMAADHASIRYGLAYGGNPSSRLYELLHEAVECERDRLSTALGTCNLPLPIEWWQETKKGFISKVMCLVACCVARGEFTDAVVREIAAQMDAEEKSDA